MLAVVLDCVHFPLFHSIADNSKQNLVTAMLQLCLFKSPPKKRLTPTTLNKNFAQKEEFPQIIKMF